MRPLLEPLCTILYDSLRPTFISMSEMDQLCELVDIMRHEVLQVGRARHATMTAQGRMLLITSVGNHARHQRCCMEEDD